jgi:putative hydrolase of the HAD superfamily
VLDLGGVLADLGDPVEAMGLDMEGERFWDIWLSSPSVRAYESGALSTQDFVREMASVLGLASAEAFASSFERWQLKPYPAAEGLVRSIPQDIRVCLLSNTNEVHWQQILSRTTIFDRFDHLFLSFRTGHYKPQESAYTQVVEHYQCDASEILFLDDSDANVRSASAQGFRATRVDGPEGAENALRLAGVLAG